VDSAGPIEDDSAPADVGLLLGVLVAMRPPPLPSPPHPPPLMLIPPDRRRGGGGGVGRGWEDSGGSAAVGAEESPNGSRGCARRLIRPRQARHEHSGARYQSRQASAGLKRRLGSTSRPGDRATRRATFRLIFKSTASTGPALRIYFNAPTRAATGNGSRAQHGRNRARLIER